MFEHGVEDFKMDPNEEYPAQWNALIDMENALIAKGGECLVKDL